MAGSSGAGPPALICLNDRIAMGVYQALADHGLDVPEDVAVISFDGSDLATWLRPASPSLRLPLRRDGRSRGATCCWTRVAHGGHGAAAAGSSQQGGSMPMTFDLDDDWVWDFWIVARRRDGQHHLFFLHAPRTLGDPDLRHRTRPRGPRRLRRTCARGRGSPTRCADSRMASTSLATWTGCTVRGRRRRGGCSPRGSRHAEDGPVQRIGVGASPTSTLDPHRRCVLRGRRRALPGQQRRPPGGGLARPVGGAGRRRPLAHVRHGARARRTPGCGVVGHAISEDLLTWEVRPPLSGRPAASSGSR